MVIWLCYFSLDLRKANRDWFADVCKHCVRHRLQRRLWKNISRIFMNFQDISGALHYDLSEIRFLTSKKTWRNWNFQCNRRHVRRSSGWVLLREMQRSLLFGQCQVRLWWFSGFFIFLELSWVSICFHMFPWFISIFFMVPDQNLPFSIDDRDVPHFHSQILDPVSSGKSYLHQISTNNHRMSDTSDT